MALKIVVKSGICRPPGLKGCGVQKLWGEPSLGLDPSPATPGASLVSPLSLSFLLSPVA